MQVIPSIAPDVEQLTVFQRTPIWCLPKLDPPLSPRLRRALERVPGLLARGACRQPDARRARPSRSPAHYYGRLPAARLFEKQARAYLEQEVEDPVVRDKLTPRYPLGLQAARASHNDYLATFNREQRPARDRADRAIEPDAVVTEDGDAARGSTC